MSDSNNKKKQKADKVEVEIPKELLETTSTTSNLGPSTNGSTLNPIPVPESKELSKNVLTMKFMQRGMEEKARQEMLKETQKQISEANWVVKYESLPIEKPKLRVEYDSSYASYNNEVEVQSEGRKSFGNFNEKVQLAAQEARDAARASALKEIEKYTTISDQDMAKRMGGKRKKRED